MRNMQGASEKNQINRFDSLPLRMGVTGTLKLLRKFVLGKRANDLKDTLVAKVIEFYIPAKFSKRVKWLPPQQMGRVIEFRLPTTKSA